MNCEECCRLESLFCESLVFADRSQTELRCYLLMHSDAAGVSDLAEYESLRHDAMRTAEERHRAYLQLMAHRKGHN